MYETFLIKITFLFKCVFAKIRAWNGQTNATQRATCGGPVAPADDDATK